MLKKYNEWKATPWTNGTYVHLLKWCMAIYALIMAGVAVYLKWEAIADKVGKAFDKIKDFCTIRVKIHKD